MQLPIDIFHDVSLYLPNADLLSLMLSCKDIHNVSCRYLQPTWEDFNRAIDKGDIVSVRLLLQHPNVDPTANNDWAIQHASKHGYTDIVRLLLQDKRCDPTVDSCFCYGVADYYEHWDVANLLLNDERVRSYFGL